MHALLLSEGLGRYYELAGTQVTPVEAPPERRTHLWLEAAVEAAAHTDLVRLSMDVQGLHCAACVWLLNETFRRRAPGGTIIVNSALGQATLVFARGFDVLAWVDEVEAFGYRFGPARKQGTRAVNELSLRLGITAALTLNVMLFSISFHFGLAPADGELFTLFTWLSAALAMAVVAVGGWPFLRAAVQGLRRGVLHLELPIAVGIVLVSAMSLWQLRLGRGDQLYFDTLSTFITLMLVGRWLQARVVERNRRYLLDDDGADGLLVRVVRHERVEATPAPRVRLGDMLLIAPGELVPVNATLREATAQLGTAWMTGESRPLSITEGATVPAGSFNAGTKAFHAEAVQTFADSPLIGLLRQPLPRRSTTQDAWWSRFASRWVVKVLVVAGVGFIVWLPHGLDRAASVAAALLVVTCPCAIGLAVPLAYELVQQQLKRRGFFVRSVDLLDRLLDVRHVVFDKTGTLTLGHLELADSSALDAVDDSVRDIALTLAARSSHPVSACLARALTRRHARYDATAQVEEVPGLGLEWQRADGLYRLGRASWAGPTNAAGTTVLSRDGVVLLAVQVDEAPRRDATHELRELATRGLDVWLLSGDSPARAQALAARIGIATERAHGGLSPEAKAEHVERIGAANTLYVGDGVNDAPAFERALAAGTPAADRPVVPARSDFFLVDGGLQPLREALDAAQRLRRVVKRLMAVSVAYNVVAVGACLSGVMSPLVAAVAMPASTLSLLALTVASLSPPASAPRGVEVSA